jgi:hypothetical protein
MPTAAMTTHTRVALTFGVSQRPFGGNGDLIAEMPEGVSGGRRSARRTGTMPRMDGGRLLPLTRACIALSVEREAAQRWAV